MDTNSIIPAQKKVVNVEILHLDELGYGPQGKHTRRDWRTECLENLRKGKADFEIWQEGWAHLINEDEEKVRFGCALKYDDGSSVDTLSWNTSPGYALDFSGYFFETDIFLNHYIFKQKTLFSGTVFQSDIYFGAVTFEDDVDFECCDFNTVSFFENTKFKRNTDFNKTVFRAVVFFSCCSFDEFVCFNQSIFLQYADFHEAIIEGTFEAKNVKFYNNVFFYKSQFSNKDASINFHRTEFFEKIDFYDSNINCMISFDKVVFYGDVNFNRTIFNEKSYFSKAKFLGKCLFFNTIFKKYCDFENASFENIGYFEGAFFQTKVPAFRGCKIDETRLEFSDKTKFSTNDFDDGAIENVSFLKRLSDEHGQTDQALRFNAIELRLKRLSSNSDIGYKTVTWLYEKLSDYGRSFMRPILSYITLLVVSAIIAMTYSTYSKSPVEESQVLCKQTKDQPQLKLSYERAVFEYAMFRAGGLMDFTDTGKQNNAVNCRLFEEPIEPPLMRAWGIFKGIASIALLFLAALGLRNKYRIK